MPKTRAIAKRGPKYGRRTYVPQLMRVPTIHRPLASKYGDELFIKVQKVLPLETTNLGNVFAYMRNDQAASTANNIALYDQPEF